MNTKMKVFQNMHVFAHNCSMFTQLSVKCSEREWCNILNLLCDWTMSEVTLNINYPPVKSTDDWLIKSMEQSSSWEANRSSSSQEISCIVCNLKVHYHIHKTPPLVLLWARSSWRSILILSSCICINLPSSLFASDLLTKGLFASFLSLYVLRVLPISFVLIGSPE